MFRIPLSCFLLLLVACLDGANGPEMGLSTLYLLVVAAASWNLRPSWLVFYAIATVLLWQVAEQLSGVHYSSASLMWWNTMNHLGVVTITACLVSKARITLDHQQRLIRELGKTLVMVNQLKELVPVCRICHKVHPDDDYQTRLSGMTEEGMDPESLGTVCQKCLEERAARVAGIQVEKYFST